MAVDLAALQQAAARTDTPNALVSRRWLREVARELAELRTSVSLQRGQDIAIGAIEARQ